MVNFGTKRQRPGVHGRHLAFDVFGGGKLDEREIDGRQSDTAGRTGLLNRVPHLAHVGSNPTPSAPWLSGKSLQRGCSMDGVMLTRKFNSLGARLRLGSLDRGAVRLDVARDDSGEYFDLRVNERWVDSLEVVDVKPRERHLVLMARMRESRGDNAKAKEKFLCGHDERHWFVAAVPDRAASTVRSAMESLKPVTVRQLQARNRVRFSKQNRRKNRAFVRQGEWFFMPAPELLVRTDVVLHDEPIQRGNGRPHRCEFLYRVGGEPVYVNDRQRRVLTANQYAKMLQRDPKVRGSDWRLMRRNALVYVKGRISHPDHKTVRLHCWHRVAMNTEFEAPAMRHVAFLD